MAAYGLKYFCEFDQLNLTQIEYRLEFLFKYYNGPVQRIMGEAKVVTQSYQVDDPFVPVKGSSLNINILNEGWLPVKSFYSNEDDGVQVKLYQDNVLMWIGFVVQDDCQEPLVDFTHVISLTATDGLGLLKDVSFGESTQLNANVLYKIYEKANVILSAPNFVIINGCNYKPVVGTPFYFNSIQYFPLSVTSGATTTTVVVSGSVVNTPGTNGYVSVFGTFSMFERNNLLAMIRTCVRNTSLELPVNVYCNLFEAANYTTNSMLQQIFVDAQTYVDKNCYETLESILSRFGLSLFQAFGEWQIVRTNEIKYYSNHAIPFFRYDAEYWSLTSTGNFDQNITTGVGLDIRMETGNVQRIYRPFRYVRETYTYQQPKELVRNLKMNELGNLIREYQTGSGTGLLTYKEYEFKYWEFYNPSGVYSVEFFIRIITDYLGHETDRYVVIKGTAFFVALVLKPIKSVEVGEGDRISFGFSIRTTNSQAGNINFLSGLQLSNTGVNKFANEVPYRSWVNGGVAWTTNIPSSDNSNRWRDVTIEPVDGVPSDGLITPYLPHLVNSGATNETQLKNFSFVISPYVNKSTKISGQTHTSEIQSTTSNRNESDLIIDDSPRNSISGTLFTTNFNGLLQRRTAIWKRATVTESLRVGEIITRETEQQRSVPRPIIDCSFNGIIDGSNTVSMLSVVTNEQMPGENFVFGKLEIDYRNKRFTGTLWSIYNDDDLDADINYNFEYLYKTD